jgi:hypothetical protein
MNKPSKRRAAPIHPDQLILFGAVETSAATSAAASSGDGPGTPPGGSVAIGSPTSAQAHPQGGPSAGSGAQGGLPESQAAPRGAAPGPFTFPPRHIPTFLPSPSAHRKNHLSLTQGTGPSGCPDPALHPDGEQVGRPKGSDSRSPRMKLGGGTKNPPAPEPGNAGSYNHDQGARAKAGGTDTVCIGAPTPSCGDHPTSDGQEVQLGVPVSQLLEIYELLRPIISGEPPAASRSSRPGGGGTAGTDETD